MQLTKNTLEITPEEHRLLMQVQLQLYESGKAYIDDGDEPAGGLNPEAALMEELQEASIAAQQLAEKYEISETDFATLCDAVGKLAVYNWLRDNSGAESAAQEAN